MNNTEHGQRILIDGDLDHSYDSTDELLSDADESNYGSNSSSNEEERTPGTIRFQVVIWNIGNLDIVSGAIPMTFRVCIFWNDTGHKRRKKKNYIRRGIAKEKSMVMHGRNKAVCRVLSGDSLDGSADDDNDDVVDIPPLSILNVATFETIGSAEVDMLQRDTRLMRWTCMYRAVVVQDNLSVSKFPHDSHEICLKMSILAHRRRGQRWDRRLWKLDLATLKDAQTSTRATPKVPHGLVVDHAKIPGFQFDPNALQFRFISQMNGAFDRGRFSLTPGNCDDFLQISLRVLRKSGYYDNNIVPILALLNLVAASVIFAVSAENFFFRSLLILNIAFNEIGVRMTVDKHLPSVGYPIHLQRILNEFFFVLLALILESAIVVVLVDCKYHNRFCFPLIVSEYLDVLTVIAALTHNIRSVTRYYDEKRKAKTEFKNQCRGNDRVGWSSRSSFAFNV